MPTIQKVHGQCAMHASLTGEVKWNVLPSAIERRSKGDRVGQGIIKGNRT